MKKTIATNGDSVQTLIIKNNANQMLTTCNHHQNEKDDISAGNTYEMHLSILASRFNWKYVLYNEENYLLETTCSRF